MHSKTPNLTVCQPEVVVSHYFDVTATSLSERLRTTKISDAQCLPACRRTEFRVTADRNRRLPASWRAEAPFRFAMTFNDLQSVEYDEVVTTSLPGFISQIGGQYGLWLGITSTVIIQLLFSVYQWLWVSRKRCRSFSA
ncbi:Protein DEL-8 [Aphelenchoides avenae]|nr:Protein DEL-8 [Aphelenchus avenae]